MRIMQSGAGAVLCGLPTLTFYSIDQLDRKPTCGGFSEKMVARDRFVLSSRGAGLVGTAPLLCARITTRSPLRQVGVKKGTNVWVVVLGGLCYMALKPAKGLDANVTLFTRFPGKEEDAPRFGADDAVISTDQSQMANVNGKFGLIIDTVPCAHNINPYIPSLSINGMLVLAGFVDNLEPTLNTSPVIMGGKSVAGSNIGGIAETQELVDFYAEHGITADTEVVYIQDVNKAFGKRLKSDAIHRFVIDMASLKE